MARCRAAGPGPRRRIGACLILLFFNIKFRETARCQWCHPLKAAKKKRDLSVFDPVPGCATSCQAVGVAKSESAEGANDAGCSGPIHASEPGPRGASTRGLAAPGREMEVALLLLAAAWTNWFWTILILWSLLESVAILRQWERLLSGA